MYSLRTQKKAAFLLYIMLFIVVLQMPFRYTNLFLHDMSFWSLLGKYMVVGASAVFLLIMIYMYFTVPVFERRYDIRHFRDIAIIAFCTAIIGIVVGFINDGRLYFVLGDSFRHIAPWIFFFLFLWVFQVLVSAGKVDTIEHVLGFMAIIGIIEAVATYVMRYADPTLRMSTYLYSWTIFWGLYQKKYSLFIVLPLVLFAVSAPLISGKRSPIIILAITGLIYSVYIVREVLLVCVNKGDSKYLMRQVLSILLLIMILLAVLPVVADYVPFVHDSFWYESAAKTVNNVYEIVTGRTIDPSYEGRWVEWDNIVEYMKNRPEWWLWGAGFGVEFVPEDARVVLTPEQTMHNVHQAWGAYFLRSGAIGLFLFFWFFAKNIWYFVVGPKNYANWQYLCATVLILCVISSFSSNIMQESFGEGFYAAMLHTLIYAKVAPVRMKMVPQGGLLENDK